MNVKLYFNIINFVLQDKGSRCNGSVNNLYSGSSSPFAETDENVTGPDFSDVIVPPGWRLETDLENSCQCYINILTGAKVSKNL